MEQELSYLAMRENATNAFDRKVLRRIMGPKSNISIGRIKVNTSYTNFLKNLH